MTLQLMENQNGCILLNNLMTKLQFINYEYGNK